MSLNNFTTPSCVSNHLFQSSDDFNEFIKYHKTNDFNILQINTRSIEHMAKFDQLLGFVESFECHFDVMIVGESWLHYDTSDLYMISG